MSDTLPSQSENKTFHTVAEIAEILNISRKGAWSLIIREKIPYYRIGQKTIRVLTEDFARWLESRYMKGTMHDRLQ